MQRMMVLEEFLRLMDSGAPIEPGSQAMEIMQELSWNARWITNYLNCVAHTPDIVRRILTELISAPVDETVTLYPPFFADCGKNLHLGKRILIQQSCHLQDQGGIYIGDDCVIDSAVTICTLDRDLDPQRRDVLYPRSVVLEPSVWIGAHSTLLPGIRIEEGAVVLPGSVVADNVLRRTLVAGVPAAYVRDI